MTPDFASSAMSRQAPATGRGVRNHEALVARHFPSLGEGKQGNFQTGGFPTSFGKGPDCVADPFGTVPRGCS